MTRFTTCVCRRPKSQQQKVADAFAIADREASKKNDALAPPPDSTTSVQPFKKGEKQKKEAALKGGKETLPPIKKGPAKQAWG